MKKKKRFISLNIKVFLLALVIMIIPSTIVGSLLYQKSIDIISQKQEILVRNAFKNITDSLEINMENAGNMSLFIISDDTIRTTLKDYDMDREEMLQSQNEILSSLTFFTGQKTYIESLCIEGNNGITLALGESMPGLSESDKIEIREQNGGSVWKWEKTNDSGKAKLFLMREINDIENPGSELGILKIGTASSVLKEQFADFAEMYPGYIAIWDHKGNEIYAYGEQAADSESLENALQNSSVSEGLTEVSDRNRDILSYYYQIPDSDWVLVSSMRFSTLYAENDVVRNLLFIGVLISFLLCVLIAVIFSRTILRPLKQLTHKIGEIADENYKIRLDFRSNDEIGALSNSFNNMAKRLDELVNEVLKGKMLQREAQFKALQAQINPHFLYNNLDTAYWMSRLEKAEKTGKILLALSALYRSTVSTEGKMIPVSTEVQYAKDYILIQQLRFDSMIQFETDIEKGVMNMSTLRFILQPLIENSIEHGILPTGKPGIIKIHIYQSQETLLFSVEDSGQGDSIAELEKLLEDGRPEQKRGMAVRNIHQRIKLQYGPQYGLHFEKSDLGGIRAVVKQPAALYEATVSAE